MRLLAYRLRRRFDVEAHAWRGYDLLRGDPLGMIWRLQLGFVTLTRWHRFTWPRNRKPR